jgi:hypothetical protein
LFGIAVLRAGTRRNTFTRALHGFLELFGDRLLPFDSDAARHYTALAVAACTPVAASDADTSPPRVAASSRHVTRHHTRPAGSKNTNRHR